MDHIAIAFFAVIAVAAAALPRQTIDAQAKTLRFNSKVGVDSFDWDFETSNGIKANEAGHLKQIGNEAGIATQGEYSYTAPDGQQIRVTYIADENGFQPHSDHSPVLARNMQPTRSQPPRTQPITSRKPIITTKPPRIQTTPPQRTTPKRTPPKRTITTKDPYSPVR